MDEIEIVEHYEFRFIFSVLAIETYYTILTSYDIQMSIVHNNFFIIYVNFSFMVIYFNQLFRNITAY